MKSIHILGICGTFMAGAAVLAKAAGYQVTGSDAQVYPPMSTQLQAEGIELIEGYDPQYIPKNTDLVVIGNVMRRGNPSVEYVLNEGIPYQSGPEFLAEHCFQHQWVLAVTGTHGKTTTASMLAWILEYAGLAPGFLIGGVPGNFSVSARKGRGQYFVVEGDEYDSAFFDKRSKFLHYRPRTLIMNNLEFDHADIFDSLDDIKKQFHQLVRTVPGNGLIITPSRDKAIAAVLQQGCWSPVEAVGSTGLWQANDVAPDGSHFAVYHAKKSCGTVGWTLIGLHNVQNALAAIAAAHHAGVKPEIAVEALCQFIPPKRRMELRGCVNDITLYDDFAHHPTAIATTLNGLRNKIGKEARIVAVLELGSYTMKSGVHKDSLLPSLAEANAVLLVCPVDQQWSLNDLIETSTQSHVYTFKHADEIVTAIPEMVKRGDHIVVMSNKGFDGIHEKILKSLGELQ